MRQEITFKEWKRLFKIIGYTLKKGSYLNTGKYHAYSKDGHYGVLTANNIQDIENIIMKKKYWISFGGLY